MAKILLGAMLGEIRGSQGGTVFSRNRYANYTRNKTIPVNPRSTAQTSIRASFGNLAMLWSTLDPETRNAWNNAASAITKTNNLGLTYSPSGYNYFIGIQMQRIVGGIGYNPALPDSLEIFALNVLFADSDSTDLNISWAYTDPSFLLVPADSRVRIQATAPVSAGIDFIEESMYKRLEEIAPGSPRSLDAIAPYHLRVSDSLPPGMAVFIRARSESNLDPSVNTPWVERKIIIGVPA